MKGDKDPMRRECACGGWCDKAGGTGLGLGSECGMDNEE
jgi:hypothetical protein